MVDIPAAWGVHAVYFARGDVCLDAGAVVGDNHKDAARVPAQHRLLLQSLCRVPKPPAGFTGKVTWGAVGTAHWMKGQLCVVTTGFCTARVAVARQMEGFHNLRKSGGLSSEGTKDYMRCQFLHVISAGRMPGACQVNRSPR